MRILLKRLSKMIIGYGAVQWAGPVISLLFTKIITQIAAPADYGSAGLILAFVAGVGAFATYTIPQAMVTHYNDFDDLTWKRQIAGGALLSGSFYGLIIGVILILLAPTLIPLITRDPADAYLLRLGAPTVLLAVSSTIIVSVAQAAMRVRLGMLFSFVAIFTTILSNVIFIVIFRLPAVGLIAGPMISYAFMCLTAMIWARPLFVRPTNKTIRILLRSSLWLIPTAISWWVLYSSDRLFLAQVVDKTAIGHYEIAVKIASLLAVFMAPLYSAITPLALSMQNDPLIKERYVAMARYLVGIALVASLGLGLFATEILIVLTRAEYLPAAPYVGVMTYVHIIAALGTMLTVNQLAHKRLLQLGLITGVGAIANLILNALLIPRWGVWGAAVATVIGMAIPMILSYLESRQRRALPYPMRLFGLALCIHLLILSIGIWMPAMYFPMRVGLKLLLMSGFIAAAIWIGLITQAELQQSVLLIQRQLKRVSARLFC